MPPVLRETGQHVVRQAARQAAVVYQAVVKGPQPPAPAGWGVEPAAFRSALPWLRWRELAEFANLFGQRGSVVREIAAELAAEVGRRLGPKAGHTSLESPTPSASSGSPAEVGFTSDDGGSATMAGMALSEVRQPWEVAAVAYSFSKLVPQLPEYEPVYAAVADGIQRDAWSFSRLQRGLVATAFADAQRHLADAMPAVLRPALRSLRDDEEVTADELRYLVYACSRLPTSGPLLTVNEVEALAACVVKVVGTANFSKVSHILAGWLHIKAPAGAKAAYLDALRVACERLHGRASPGEPTIRPAPSAHPLPADGFAPAITALLAREEQRETPPLTPPCLRDIVLAFVQMSRGILSTSETRARNKLHSQALSLADWTKILQSVFDFCEGHAPLPNWAAQVLGFVVSKAPLHPRRDDLPEQEALLDLLRFCRIYRPKPAPTEHFFDWVAEQLMAHQRQSGESALLAECIRELVPCLAAERRQELTQMLLAQLQDVIGSVEHEVVAVDVRRRARPLLAGRVWRSTDHPGVTLGANLATPTVADATANVSGGAEQRRVSASRLLAHAKAGAVPGGRLWGLLADDLALQAATARNQDSEGIDALRHEELSLCQVDPAAASTDLTAASPKERLQQLDDQLEERSAAAAEPIPSPPMQSIGDSSPLPPYAFPGQTPTHSLFSEWAAQEATPAGVGELRLHRPFVFEDFRRANSQRLQSERLRVVVPRDQVSMWSLPKK